jgi:soluble lytic murein transglycosylase-like protein
VPPAARQPVQHARSAEHASHAAELASKHLNLGTAGVQIKHARHDLQQARKGTQHLRSTAKIIAEHGSDAGRYVDAAAAASKSVDHASSQLQDAEKVFSKQKDTWTNAIHPNAERMHQLYEAGNIDQLKQTWKPVLEEAARRVQVPQSWVTDPRADYIISHESNYDPLAANPTSTAWGLGQLLDATAEGVGIAPGTHDPLEQAVGFYRYLKSGGIQSHYDHKVAYGWY